MSTSKLWLPGDVEIDIDVEYVEMWESIKPPEGLMDSMDDDSRIAMAMALTSIPDTSKPPRTIVTGTRLTIRAPDLPEPLIVSNSWTTDGLVASLKEAGATESAKQLARVFEEAGKASEG